MFLIVIKSKSVYVTVFLVYEKPTEFRGLTKLLIGKNISTHTYVRIEQTQHACEYSLVQLDIFS